MNESAVASRAITLRGATKHYRGGIRGLDRVDLEVPRGVICGLIGPNGSGKSTLLKLAAGLAWPDAGEVVVAGATAGSGAARAAIGYLPEAPDYPPGVTVREFLVDCGRLSGLGGAGLEAAIARRMEWSGLQAVLSRRASELSKGQRQRLGLAQALLHEPEVLLLDEPASGLDPVATRRLAGMLAEVRAEGRTVLLATHFLPEIEQACDRLVMLADGRIRWQGTPVEAGTAAELYVRLADADECVA